MIFGSTYWLAFSLIVIKEQVIVCFGRISKVFMGVFYSGSGRMGAPVELNFNLYHLSNRLFSILFNKMYKSLIPLIRIFREYVINGNTLWISSRRRQ